MERSITDLWANFLFNEKLDPVRIREEKWILLLIALCEKLASIQRPNLNTHKTKLDCRKLVCETAMEMGIDLPGIKSNKGKYLIGRGLLDMWNKVTAEKYGSAIGTQSEWEAKRRNVVTRLSKELKKGVGK